MKQNRIQEIIDKIEILKSYLLKDKDYMILETSYGYDIFTDHNEYIRIELEDLDPIEVLKLDRFFFDKGSLLGRAISELNTKP